MKNKLLKSLFIIFSFLVICDESISSYAYVKNRGFESNELTSKIVEKFNWYGFFIHGLIIILFAFGILIWSLAVINNIKVIL